MSAARVALVVEFPEGDALGYGNVVKYIGTEIDTGITSGTIDQPGGLGSVRWALVDPDEDAR